MGGAKCLNSIWRTDFIINSYFFKLDCDAMCFLWNESKDLFNLSPCVKARTFIGLKLNRQISLGLSSVSDNTDYSRTAQSVSLYDIW